MTLQSQGHSHDLTISSRPRGSISQQTFETDGSNWLLWETESNGHLNDVVVWQQMVNVFTPKSLRCHILTTVQGWFNLTANRKPHIAIKMITWPMMSFVPNGDSLRLGVLLGTTTAVNFSLMRVKCNRYSVAIGQISPSRERISCCKCNL